MTHEGIEKLIDALNAGELRGRIFLSKLSERVDFARVWPKDPQGNIAGEGSDQFYFIKNAAGSYIGAVLDMGNDLHAVIKKEHRGQGDLSAAMNEVIFPKLFQDGRAIQAATFNEAKVAEYFVKRFGFKMTGAHAAEKDLSIYSNVPKIEQKGFPLSYEDVRAMELNIQRATLYLKMVKERLKTAYPDWDDALVDDLIHETFHLDDYLHARMEERRHGLRKKT
jgi:hypothetical protein